MSDTMRPTSDQARWRRLVYSLLGFTIALLVVIIAFLLFRDCCGAARVLANYEGSAGHLILFEPLDDVGGDPFMSFEDRSEITGVPPTPVTPGIGIYGGTLDNTCDKQQLISYLTSNPAKGQAWAGVQGITFAQIPAFINSLTPAILPANTLVTNHGFKNGVATPKYSLLQAGTAVLVDANGHPRARCFCGNPLWTPCQELPFYGDKDGDTILNAYDSDIDGDGLLNVNDPRPCECGAEVVTLMPKGDADGDGIINSEDRRPCTPDGDDCSGSATFQFTGDNFVTVYVNGTVVADRSTDDNWKNVVTYTGPLSAGDVIVVRVVNGTQFTGADISAGAIGFVDWSVGSSTTTIVTDATWDMSTDGVNYTGTPTAQAYGVSPWLNQVPGMNTAAQWLWDSTPQAGETLWFRFEIPRCECPPFDGDVDGDTIINGLDPDIDGDGLLNEEDPDPCNRINPEETTTTSTTTTVVTDPPDPEVRGEYCVIDTAWDDALNVRSGPGTNNPVIGTLPFHASGIQATGNAESVAGGVWYEIVFGDDVGWVASWFLTPGPCGPLANFDVTLDRGLTTITIDPMEPAPDNQPLACGEGGDCYLNGSTTDQVTLPLDPNAEVWLLATDATLMGPLTLADFSQYLAGALYDPNVHFADWDAGFPYNLTVSGGVVIRIEQQYLP